VLDGDGKAPRLKGNFARLKVRSDLPSSRFSGPVTAHGVLSCCDLAVLKQVGNDGAALFTMFLAIMTVIPTIRPMALTGGKGRKVVLGMVAFVVAFWLLMITVPATTINNYYGSTGYARSLDFSPPSHSLIHCLGHLSISQPLVLDTDNEGWEGYKTEPGDGYPDRVWVVLAFEPHLLRLLWAHCHPLVARS
jgi:hypothetical protein